MNSSAAELNGKNRSRSRNKGGKIEGFEEGGEQKLGRLKAATIIS